MKNACIRCAIKIQNKYKNVEFGFSDELETNTLRHLRGNWLQYWGHEVGLADQTDKFNLKQIKLLTFAGADASGHTGSVRSLCVLDNESSFLSSGKDKTVKLWSLKNFGDGGGRLSFLVT